MKIGQVYKTVAVEDTCSKCGKLNGTKHTTFPFGEPYGIFLRVEPSGFLTFRLSGSRWASMNGGCYDEVDMNIHFLEKEAQ